MARKKSNKIPKIKGSRRSPKKVVIKDQKAFDEACDHAVVYRKGTKWNQSKDATYRYMSCKLCSAFTQVDLGTTATVCPTCVQEMVEPPTIAKAKVTTGRPAGWHWMAEFVDKDGTVYHKGKEQPQLKGTLEPTKIEPKKRLRKKDKQNIMREASVRIHKLKKKLARTKLKKDQKPIQVELNKLNRIALGRFPKNFSIDEFYKK